jgi:hypothetical protein
MKHIFPSIDIKTVFFLQTLFCTCHEFCVKISFPQIGMAMNLEREFRICQGFVQRLQTIPIKCN